MYTNKYYELNYNAAHNQIYWKVKGYWASVNVVPNMEKDWDAILAQVKNPGFKILADLREMKTPPDAVSALHADVQKKILQAGVSKIASIIPSAVIRISVNIIGTQSRTKQLTANFDTVEKAQAWLDEP